MAELFVAWEGEEMMSITGLAPLLSLAFFLGSPATPAIKVHNWKPIQYPPMARMARIEGTVVISATLAKSEGGWAYRVEKYQVKTGHPMLAEPAIQNLKEQLFYRDDLKSLDGAKYEVTYEFKLDRECLEEEQCFKRTSIFRAGHVLVEADSPMVHINKQTIRSK